MGSPRIWVQRTTRPISSVLHELLVHAVLDLRDCNGLAVDFTTESCEGRVTNLNTEGILGDIAGPLYDAELNMDGSEKIEVRFVFRESDLKEALNLARRGTPFHTIRRQLKDRAVVDDAEWN